jgi:hypothetical protein
MQHRLNRCEDDSPPHESGGDELQNQKFSGAVCLNFLGVVCLVVSDGICLFTPLSQRAMAEIVARGFA